MTKKSGRQVRAEKSKQTPETHPDKYINNVRVDHYRAARRYAEADRSDPFAYNRAVTHLQNGVASYGPKGENNFYDATEGTETRTVMVNGREEEYQAVVYINRQRP